MEIDLTQLTPDIRRLNDMKSVLHDKEFAKISYNSELYYMYRGLEEKDGLRYDITIVPAQMLGDEFTKTKGHYHVGAYGELYTVLEGQAIYLMQKRKPKTEDEVEDCYFVKAKKGDVVIIPSFYGHITINPSEDQDLKMANWVATSCMSDYSIFEKLNGGCYFYTTNGWVKNENYKSVPALREEQPIKSIPEDLSFLK